MAILITGSTGLVGHALCDCWDPNEQIIGVDSRRGVWPGNQAGRYSEVIGSLTDQDFLDGVLATHRPRAIIHLAALSRVVDLGDPRAEAAFVGTNVLMTSTVLNAAARADYGTHPRPHVIVAGSAVEYGEIDVNAEPPTEGAPLRPQGPYAISKVMTSMAALGFAQRYPLPVTVLRFGNVYGGDTSDVTRFIPGLIKRSLLGETTPLASLGAPMRSYVHVSDVCRAIERVIYRGSSGIFNITDPREISNLELALLVQKLLQQCNPQSARDKPLKDLLEMRQGGGGARRVAMDITRAWHVLGWRATTALEAGLTDLVQRFMKESGFEVRAA